MGILPFLAICFMVLESYVYTIAAYFYAFSFRVLHHFALHFAPFYLAFSTKTHCI